MLLRDHLALVCPTDHPLAKRRALRWTDLAGHPVLTVRPGYGIRPRIDGAAAQAGVQLEVTNEVTFLSTALWMAQCGLGAAIMPSGYARDAGRMGLVVRKLTQPVVSREISVVTKRGRSLSPAAEAFVATLRASLAVHGEREG
jgi:DNA-binding transcriptional LysR family regulator